MQEYGKSKKGYTHFADNDIGIAKITPCFENKKSVVFNDLINGYGAGTTELHIVRTISGLVIPEYLLNFVNPFLSILGKAPYSDALFISCNIFFGECIPLSSI